MLGAPGDEQGSAVVEFLLVGVLLMTLTLAVVQLALALHVRNTLQDAASEGARWGALADTSPQQGVAKTKQLIQAAIGQHYASSVTVQQSLWLGEPALEISVRAPLPLLGLFGPERVLEVSGHAIKETLDNTSH